MTTEMQSVERHMWEVDHPYYWNEGSFHERGMHVRHESWADFIGEMGDADEDLNLVCRWDWKQDDPDEDKGGSAIHVPAGTGTLKVFYVVQRKAYTFSHEVAVTAADEPAVRAWLEQKWRHLQRLWAPLAPVTSDAEG